MAEAGSVFTRRLEPVTEELSGRAQTPRQLPQDGISGPISRDAGVPSVERSSTPASPVHTVARLWRVPGRFLHLLQRCRVVLRLPDIVAEQTAKMDVALASQSAKIDAALASQSAKLDLALAALDQLGGITEHDSATLETGLDNLGKLGAALRAEFDRVKERTSSEAFNELRRELSTQIAFSLHDIAQWFMQNSSLNTIGVKIDQHSPSLVAPQLNRLANEQFEAKNQLTHIGTSTASLLQNLTTIAGEIRNLALHLDTSLHTRFNTIEHDRLGSVYEQMHDLTAALLRLRANTEVDSVVRRENPAECYKPVLDYALDVDLRRAEGEFSRVYPMWAERLEEMRKACAETKTGNVAHAGDSRSEAFRSFVEIHAAGRVLDVGCGVFGRPFYLSSYPAPLISGLDPLEPVEPPDFEFVQGIQEYLPWPDAAFSTVISATALDHCLSLDRSLAEIRRVLRPEGQLLLWIDSLPGSPRFAPDAPDFAPADRFHLFHFDAVWFEPMLDPWFETVDRVELRGLEFNRVMYCLRLRPPEIAKPGPGSRP